MEDEKTTRSLFRIHMKTRIILTLLGLLTFRELGFGMGARWVKSLGRGAARLAQEHC